MGIGMNFRLLEIRVHHLPGLNSSMYQTIFSTTWLIYHRVIQIVSDSANEML